MKQGYFGLSGAELKKVLDICRLYDKVLAS